jgi:hypothetical protein
MKSVVRRVLICRVLWLLGDKCGETLGVIWLKFVFLGDAK